MMKSDAQKEYEANTRKASEAMKEYAESLEQVNNFMEGQKSTITSVSQKYIALGNIIRGVKDENLESNEIDDTPEIQNLSEELKKLNDLLKEGILTQEEFEKAKKKLLNN